MTAIDQLNAALVGRYVVEREVGRGGMATVSLATDVRHNRHVALKDGSVLLLLKPVTGESSVVMVHGWKYELRALFAGESNR